MPTPIWQKQTSYTSKDEEVKHRNEAASKYVGDMRHKLLDLIDREMDEDKSQVEYALKNYAEMFFKQRNQSEWNKSPTGDKSV